MTLTQLTAFYRRKVPGEIKESLRESFYVNLNSHSIIDRKMSFVS